MANTSKLPGSPAVVQVDLCDLDNDLQRFVSWPSRKTRFWNLGPQCVGPSWNRRGQLAASGNLLLQTVGDHVIVVVIIVFVLDRTSSRTLKAGIGLVRVVTRRGL